MQTASVERLSSASGISWLTHTSSDAGQSSAERPRAEVPRLALNNGGRSVSADSSALGRWVRGGGSAIGSMFSGLRRSIGFVSHSTTGIAGDGPELAELRESYEQSLHDSELDGCLSPRLRLPVSLPCECSQDAERCFERNRRREWLWQSREPCMRVTKRVVGRRILVRPPGGQCLRGRLWDELHESRMDPLQLHQMTLHPRQCWAGLCAYEYRFCCEHCWPDEFFGSWDRTHRHHYELFEAYEQRQPEPVMAHWGERFEFRLLPLPGGSQPLLSYLDQPLEPAGTGPSRTQLILLQWQQSRAQAGWSTAPVAKGLL